MLENEGLSVIKINKSNIAEWLFDDWNGATRDQAIEFLERVVVENDVKLSWWVEMIIPELLKSNA